MNRLNDIRLMKHLMDNIQDNIYVMDKNGRITFINQAGARWLGFDSPEDVIGKTDLDIFTNEHGRAAFEDEQRIMKTGEPILGVEEKETWANQHETWVSTSKMPLHADDGAIVGTFGISRDITRHKKAELRAEQFAEENRKYREEMEHDLLMAAELQKTFFPSTYPSFPEGVPAEQGAIDFLHLYQPSATVSGDFCSIRKLSDTEVGILLCDIMGHGVRAALVTAIVRGVVEDISIETKDPGKFLNYLNRVLMPILRKDDLFLYATACYLVLDVKSGIFRYAIAGHPMPIVFNKDGAEWLAADRACSGPALAIDEDAAFITCERSVKPGDSVLMFTDGIYEVPGENSEDFGEERLLSTVNENRDKALEPLFQALIDKARRFAVDEKFDDDVCLAGFRFRHPM